MSRPPSEIIPDIVHRFAAKYGSISHLSENMGHANNWIKGLFANGQPHLVPYIKLAEAGGISLQALVLKIEARQSSEYVEFLIERFRKDGVKHRADLSRHIGVSKTTLHEMCKNDGRLNGLNGVVELARKIGCDVDELRVDTQLQSKTA